MPDASERIGRSSFAERLIGTRAQRYVPDSEAAALWETERLGCPSTAFRGLWAQYGDSPFRMGNRVVRIVRSCCFSCNSNCEVLVLVDHDTGKVVRVEGDPESPVTKGVLCSKGLASVQLLYNRDRLMSPLIAVDRGSPRRWREVSWEEALDLVAQKMGEYKAKYGAQSVAFIQGTRRGWSREFSRLAYVFASPSHGATGWAQCLWPRLVDGKATFGGPCMESPDYRNTRCVLVWGTNLPMTWPTRAADVMDARARGAKIIVVDPFFSEVAAKADIWLQLRPGTDSALALGMLRVIVDRRLYDKEFVERWTVGFDALVRHLEQYPVDKMSAITGVPVAAIEEAALTYASSSPACISRCVSLDQTSDPIQACRAVSLLCALTGNVDVPGGNVFPSSRKDRGRDTHEFIAYDALPQETKERVLGYRKYPLLCGELSPVPSAHMPTLWRTIISGEPYPIKAALLFGTNAVVSHANSSMVREALEKLEFIAVCDLFMTPTAEMADVLLPASTWMERDNVTSSFQCCPDYTLAQVKAVTLPGPRSDIDIVIDLAKRLGLDEWFWEDEDGLMDYLLEPTGLTFRELADVKRIHAPLEYGKRRRSGFDTPSGKVEIYSSVLEKAGVSPLPTYTEPLLSPLRDPNLAEEYPLILTTGRRVQEFRHSEHRQVEWLRQQQPRPVVLINPKTAAYEGIQDGDKVAVETPQGRVLAFAEVTSGIKPGVVQAMPGWWGEYNINLALQNEACAEGTGTTPLRGLLCRVVKVKEDASRKEKGEALR